MMSSDDYLCGIFDGEGYITATFGRDARSARLLVGVSMRSRRTIDFFNQRFGGGVHKYADREDGKVIYQWYRCGTNAKEALLVFAGGCFLKKEQAQLGLDLICLIENTKARRKNTNTGAGETFMTERNLEKRSDIIAKIKSCKSDVA